ncbi:MAG: hypothetical protein AB7F86_11245 [Bdellovibrionales bacterium]
MGLWLWLAAVALTGLNSWAVSSASYFNLDLRQNRYLGEIQHSTQEANYTQLGLDLNLEPRHVGSYNYKLSAKSQGAFESREEFYFGVPEAYVEPLRQNRGLTLTVGRKRRTWSRLDEQFALGVWQPQLRWDYLAPIQQGLTGIFLDWRMTRQFKTVFYTSPIHLPDQGPQYRLKDGQFYSSNRWFQQPTGAIRLFNETRYAEDVPLHFEIDQPSNDELFVQSGFGLGLEYDHDNGFWSHLNLAYKPRNQIHLGIECQNCATLGGGPSPLEITARIHPKTVKHFVATWETGFQKVDHRGWISLTGDFPGTSGFPAEYEEASLDSNAIVGAAYQHALSPDWVGRPMWLQYSYVRVLDLAKRGAGSRFEEDQVRSSWDRYPIRNVAAFDWRVRLISTGRNLLNWTNRYQYSIPERGGWLSSFLELEQGQLKWLLGADILGSDVEPGSQEAGLFTRYRANDRVFGGVSYVF